MQDRVPLYPGRVKLTPVSGQENTYDMTRADEPTQEGTPLNKATLLKDATAALYGLGTDAAPDDVFASLHNNGWRWKLIASYKAAGAYTWTAPSDMTIGVYMIGGGGAGGFDKNSSSTSISPASGGAAGYGKNLILDATSGTSYNLVVGKGGATVSEKGGSSSFNGQSVEGGDAGTKASTDNSCASGASGGQGSDAVNFRSDNSDDRDGRMETPAIRYGSCAARSAFGYNGTYIAFGGSSQSIRESQNWFDPEMITLCAGGCANKTLQQVITPMPDGTKGGDGKFSATSTNGNDATGNGNGGGALMLVGGSSVTGTPGKGSDGMVLIYQKI